VPLIRVNKSMRQREREAQPPGARQSRAERRLVRGISLCAAMLDLFRAACPAQNPNSRRHSDGDLRLGLADFQRN
jgi:hypothetical protein